MRFGSSLGALLGSSLLFGSALAHPADEYLQAAYIKMSPTTLRLELEMTAGEKLAPEVLRLLDNNQNQQLESSELLGYMATVLQGLQLEINQKPVSLQTISTELLDSKTFALGGGGLKLIFEAGLPNTIGTHSFEFVNRHAPVKSAYLANVFLESDWQTVLSQERNQNQSRFVVQYQQNKVPVNVAWWLLPVGLGVAGMGAWAYRKRGSR
jgi:hypothetical protein